MNINMQEKWEKLHQQSRFRPKYPAESIVQFVFRNFKRDGSSKVLDLGCGAGRHVYFMANENIDTYGVDVSRDGVAYTHELLEKNGLHASLKVGSVDDIPYENEYFDGVICYGVLYYCKIEQIKKAVKEIHRVLKTGGLLYLVVRDINDYRYGQGKEIENNTFLISEDDDKKSAFSENGMMMHFFTEAEIKDLFNTFKDTTIDKVIVTHENGKYCDSNLIVTTRK
jgi:cyclopropane fatty-acyl-phospholipid synthase-like methyltransferase